MKILKVMLWWPTLAFATPNIEWIETCALKLFDYAPNTVEQSLQAQSQCFRTSGWQY